jgi:hypothetical protein
MKVEVQVPMEKMLMHHKPRHGKERQGKEGKGNKIHGKERNEREMQDDANHSQQQPRSTRTFSFSMARRVNALPTPSGVSHPQTSR